MYHAIFLLPYMLLNKRLQKPRKIEMKKVSTVCQRDLAPQKKLSSDKTATISFSAGGYDFFLKFVSKFLRKKIRQQCERKICFTPSIFEEKNVFVLSRKRINRFSAETNGCCLIKKLCCLYTWLSLLLTKFGVSIP